MSEQFNVKQVLNTISEEVVFLEIDEKQSLGIVLNGIEKLQKWSEENNFEQSTIVLGKLVSILESLILDESENPDHDIEIIGNSISEIQNIVENGYSDNELHFAEELIPSSKNNNTNIIDDDIVLDFIQKHKIELEEYDGFIIAFEQSGDTENIEEIKRKLHNLKGESAIIGITDIEQLCHKTEDWLLEEKSGNMENLFLVIDWLKNKIKSLEKIDVELEPVDKIIEKLFIDGDQIDEKVKNSDEKSAEKHIIPEFMPANVDEDIFSDFLSNQVTVLEDLENYILKLDTNEKESALSEILRALHTLKGEANLMGLTKVGDFCHKSESYIAGNDQISDFLFVLKDWLSNTFEYYTGKIEVLPGDEKITNFFPENISNDKKEVKQVEISDDELEPIDDLELLVDFISEAEEHLEMANSEMLIFEETKDVEKINGIFRAFHTIKGVAGFLNLNDVKIISHNAEDLLDKIRKQKITLSDNILDIVYKSIDKLKELMQSLAEYAPRGVKPPPNPTIHILINELSAVISGKKVEIEKTESPTTQPVPETSKAVKPSTQKLPKVNKTIQKGVKIKENIKVDAARLDHLIDFIGELAIAESMLTQSNEIRKFASTDLRKRMNRLDKITKEVQSTSMGLRMVTVRSTFQKMARLVRDLSKKSKKLVEFKMHGEDTELDKNVVEQIGDPLVHLIRNAVDHGIESTPEERIKNNKDKTGHVDLSAYHKGGNIYIEIRDDGKGLDREAILNKAIEKEIISPTSNLKDGEVWNLIFEPGFSTAKVVTDVSGRGVGMDVVRKNIEAMRGHVNITSEKGKGSVFSIILPLTLAIIDGMVIKVGTERYIIPTLSVITSLRPEKEQCFTVVDKGEMIKFQNILIPIFRLGNHFEIKDCIENIHEGIVVIVETGVKKIGLLIDTLLGQQQIVIKSLKGDMKDIKGISGGAIMPDGTVALILDIGGISELASEKNHVAELNK